MALHVVLFHLLFSLVLFIDSLYRFVLSCSFPFLLPHPPSLNSSPPYSSLFFCSIYFLPICFFSSLFLPLSLSLHLPPSIFVSYLYRLICFLFLQLNVVRGSGRFIPTPPYPSYLYARVLKRDQVR